ncbi:hypothetical protein BCR36DRAFT_254397, partial [Piromyces finnis]
IKSNYILLFLLFKNVICSYYSKTNLVVNIVNVNSSLCLSYKKEDYRARLSECNTTNKKQQWILPKNGVGYFVNMYDNNICLYVGDNGTTLTSNCSKYKSNMVDVKNANGYRSISDISHSDLCLGV